MPPSSDPILPRLISEARQSNRWLANIYEARDRAQIVEMSPTGCIVGLALAVPLALAGSLVVIVRYLRVWHHAKVLWRDESG